MDAAAQRKVFEETLTKTMQTYAPIEEAIVEATMTLPSGAVVVIARYRVYPDGRWERLGQTSPTDG